jgi:hypothetical protein
MHQRQTRADLSRLDFEDFIDAFRRTGVATSQAAPP